MVGAGEKVWGTFLDESIHAFSPALGTGGIPDKLVRQIYDNPKAFDHRTVQALTRD